MVERIVAARLELAESERQVPFLKTAYGIGAVVFSRDGHLLAVADRLTQALVLWDVATGKETDVSAVFWRMRLPNGNAL